MRSVLSGLFKNVNNLKNSYISKKCAYILQKQLMLLVLSIELNTVTLSTHTHAGNP